MPNPHKSEIKSNTGVTYIKRILNMKYNIAFLATISSDGLTSHPTTRQRINELNGNITVDVTKSNKSNIVFPKIWKSFKTPKESVHGIINNTTITHTERVAFCLVIFKLSPNAAIAVSSIEIEDVNAANNNNTKNNTAMKFPQNGSCSNT